MSKSGRSPRALALVLEAIQSTERDLPDYLEVDHNKMTARLPRSQLSDVPYPVVMEPNLVVSSIHVNPLGGKALIFMAMRRRMRRVPLVNTQGLR